MDYSSEEFTNSILSPELLGPIFKVENVTLRQVLYNTNTSTRFKLLATFVPDELIYLLDSQNKLVDYSFVILLYVDISEVYSLYNDFAYANNNGSCGLSKVLNMYTTAIIEQIYFNGGDVIKFTDHGILSIWKPGIDALPHVTVQKVISSAFSIKESISFLNTDQLNDRGVPIKTAVSLGKITFSSIGEGQSDNILRYIITGEPVTAVYRAINVCPPNEIILTESAWKYCILDNYLYVIQDQHHIMLTEDLKRRETEPGIHLQKDVEYICKPELDLENTPSNVKQRMRFLTTNVSKMDDSKKKQKKQCVVIVHNLEMERMIVLRRHSILKECKNSIDSTLRRYVLKKIINQVDKDLLLDHLTELRNVSVIVLNVATRYIKSVHEQIKTADMCFDIILKACEDVGIIYDVSLFNENILFRIIFGTSTNLQFRNHCKFSVLFAKKVLPILRNLYLVDEVCIGISTDIVCCAVVGNIARRCYVVIGPPISKAESIMLISRNKITCDLDTVVYSGIPRSEYRSSGLINLRGYGKAYVFVYFGLEEVKEVDAIHDLEVAYPILSRFEELELFSLILDDIGVADRKQSGIIIEGVNKIGKSRILDAYAAIAQSRHLTLIRLVLHSSFAVKPYSVIHKVAVQMLGLEDCKTINEFEDGTVAKIGHLIHTDDFCYMNRILRVRFKLSKQFIKDSDWNRHRKSLLLFEKMLKTYGIKYCILLDNVQYIDYMSWQFLSQAVSDKNIVMAFTILKPDSWDELSRVETDIYRDNRFIRHEIGGLEFQSLVCLVCQFLEVDGFSMELYNFIMHMHINNPGWYQLFVTLMILCCAFDLVRARADEVNVNEICFPPPLLISRIPANVTPDEIAPTKPWFKKRSVSLCLVNENFQLSKNYEVHNHEGLALDIFAKLTIYEQDLIKCAAVIGSVFTRSMLELILPNHQSFKMAAAIENLIRVRIFECAALQRRRTKVGELAVCSLKPRCTFSDMHHLLLCRCHLPYIPPEERHLARYAHCRFMEFKETTLQKVVYAHIADIERREIHARIVEVYKKDARKCAACGGGSFLRIPGKEKYKKVIKSTAPATANNLDFWIESQNQNALNKVESPVTPETPKTPPGSAQSSPVFPKAPKPSMILFGIDSPVEDSNERYSISDRKLLREHHSEEINRKLMDDVSGISVMRTIFETSDSEASDIFSGITKSRRRESKKRRRRNRLDPVWEDGSTGQLHLNNFGHIDFRNCRCLMIINCTFLKMWQHIENIEKNERVVNFMMEYAAALIEFGQPSYALRFLNMADERNDYLSTISGYKNLISQGKMIKKTIIYYLKGNAYMHLGNYPQARANYIDAVCLYKHEFTFSDLPVCCKTKYEKLRQIFLWSYFEPTVDSTGKSDISSMVRQCLATALHLLSKQLMVSKEYKVAKLTSIQCISIGFSTYDVNSFYDQCRLFITTVKVYGRTGDLSFLNHIEKYMLFAVNQKSNWNNTEDVIMLIRVYKAIFKISLLEGKFEKALFFGERALRTAKCFHIIRLELDIMPPMIQVLVMVANLKNFPKENKVLTSKIFSRNNAARRAEPKLRLKRLCEMVDILHQLHDTAIEDVDKSALTWYYALCMDMLMDAGVIIESFETCSSYAKKILAVKTESLVMRDPHSLKRLVASLWLCQLRRGDLRTAVFVKSLNFFTKSLKTDSYSQLITLGKIFECHLLLLTRCVNLKKNNQMEMLMDDVHILMDMLNEISIKYHCIRPHFYLLKAYYYLIRARNSEVGKFLKRAKKAAEQQKNLYMLASIAQNKKTWEAVSYNHMARYWEENVGREHSIVWQDVDMFDLDDWTNLFYSLPVPDSCI